MEKENEREVLVKALRTMYWRCHRGDRDAEGRDRVQRWARELAEEAGIDFDLITA